MSTRIALRIHVGTLAGARRGVPHLIQTLQSIQAGASFLLCLGPDRSGQAFWQAMKMASCCGWSLPLQGTLIPAKAIGKKALKELQQIEEAGFEAGLSAWSRVDWEKKISTADNTWVTQELEKAINAFEEIFAHAPKVFGAPDWQGHRHHLRLLQRKGFTHASDCWGTTAFLPVFQGEALPCPQLPTTLPTLEVLIKQKQNAADAVKALLDLTRNAETPQIFSLSAEYEGLGHRETLITLLQGWQEQGHQLVSLGALTEELSVKTMPYAYIGPATNTYRTTPLFLQGENYLG